MELVTDPKKFIHDRIAFLEYEKKALFSLTEEERNGNTDSIAAQNFRIGLHINDLKMLLNLL